MILAHMMMFFVLDYGLQVATPEEVAEHDDFQIR